MTADGRATPLAARSIERFFDGSTAGIQPASAPRSLGGKARGLRHGRAGILRGSAGRLARGRGASRPGRRSRRLAVVATEFFDAFLDGEPALRAGAWPRSRATTRSRRAFQRAEPSRASWWATSSALISNVHAPLAVPLLEPARGRPGSPLRGRLRHQDDPQQPVRRRQPLPRARRRGQVRLRVHVLPRGARLHRAAVGRSAARREDGGDHPGGRGPAARRALLPGHLGRRALVQLLSRRATPSPERGCRRAWPSASARRSSTEGCAGPSPRAPAEGAPAVQLGCATCSSRRRRVLGGQHGAARRRTTR